MSKKTFILIVLYLGFISLGLPDQVLGIAWPTMRLDFSKPLESAGLLFSLCTVFTAVSGYSSGFIIQRFSEGNILIASCLLTVLGLFGYGISNSWFLLLFFTLPYGLGAGTVDSVLNRYVALNYSSKHMNWLHGFWGIGATLGPAVMTSVMAVGMTWRTGYFVLAGIQCILIAFFWSARKSFTTDERQEISAGKATKSSFNINVFFSAFFFFIYTAVEGSIGLWFYSILTEGRQVSGVFAGYLIAMYWFSLTIGRFSIGFISKYVRDKTLITASILCAGLGVCLLIPDNIVASICGLVITGCSLAGIYPCMMSETPKRFDSGTCSTVMGYQVGSACLGVALLNPFIGIVIQKFGFFLFPLILLSGLALLLFIDLKLKKLNTVL